MNFNNATLLTHTRNSEFFSDTMRYRVVKNLTIQGLLLDLANDNGVTNILSDLQAFRLSLISNWQDVILNGVNFGKGTIENVSFSPGNDVKIKEYTVSISIPEDGDTTTQGYYQGLNFSHFKYIESFSESSEFTRNLGRDNYTHNINITIKPPTTIDAINAAKDIAENFFNNNNLSSTIGNFTSYANTKKYYTENYDPINGEFSFSRNFELYKNSDGNFSLSRVHRIDFSKDGVLSVTESAEYLGHTSTPFDTVNTQAKTDINNAYSRCATLVSSYSIGGDEALNSKPLSKSWNSIPFDGRLSYEITFSNHLRINNGTFGAFHDYSIDVETSKSNSYKVSQKGSIIGFGDLKTSAQKYNNALGFFQTISPNFSMYAIPGTLQLISTSVTHNQINGKIDYTYIYTNDDSIATNQDIRKIVTTISRQYRRYLSSSFNIINYKEIIQIQPNRLPNNINYNIKLNGKSTVGLNTYLNAARQQITQNQPPAPSYINNVNYTFNPFDRELTLTVDYLNFETQ